MIINRVYKFGCRKPLEENIALQLLGQASNYRKDLRKVYNNHKKKIKDMFSANAEVNHVRLFELANLDESSHVLAFERFTVWDDFKLSLNEELRIARSKRGHLLDAGTYWLIEADMLAASKASGNDPIKRKQFDWTGRIGAAIQSKEQFPATEFSHKRVAIIRNPDKPKYFLLTIKVGELKDNRSITFPIHLHRDFPADAMVKQVALQRIRNGHRFNWQALITIAFEQQDADVNATGTVGIDIGWRQEENGMRVATYDGVHDSDFLTINTLSEFEYADTIRSLRDKNFDLVKAYAADKNIPGAEHAKLWKDKSRMYRLANKTLDLGLVWWRERDKHLEDIEVGVRAKAMRRRLYKYRQLASDLAKKYKYVAIEDMPMNDWVGEGETHAKERKRSVGALYIFQLVIGHRFGDSRTDWVPPEYTSMRCSACGTMRESPVGPAPRWICEHCNTEHHQDENAAIIIRKDSENRNGGGNTVRARSRKSLKTKKKVTVKEAA